MNTEKLGRGLTLAANLGVIAGLILVAVQINQNTQITKAQIANDYFLAGMAHEGWQERLDYLGWHLGNEVGRRWWESVRGDYSAEFREQVDGILARGGYSSNRELLDALLSADPVAP